MEERLRRTKTNAIGRNYLFLVVIHLAMMTDYPWLERKHVASPGLITCRQRIVIED
jgi:hypothetical protein